MQYEQHFPVRETPQAEKIPGSTQVPNSAGGHAWAVDDWIRLERFLILGTEGGTYYAQEKPLTQENAQAVLRCIQSDGPRAVATIAAISHDGRAHKNDPAIFALALAAAMGAPSTRQAALAAIPTVCRIGTHLFHFARAHQSMRGWGRGLRRAVGAWYQRDCDRVAEQCVKYVQRDGWTHKDLLRLAHPAPPTAGHDALYKYVVGKDVTEGLPPVVQSVRRLQALGPATKETAPQVATLLREAGLPREAVETTDTKYLTYPEVWRALLPAMPMTAMIRNLGVMTTRGVLTPFAEETGTVIERLGDMERLRKARVHPIQILAALLAYKGGQSRGGVTWSPVAKILDALDGAFYQSFGLVEPTGKRIMLALDVSGSMSSGLVAGINGLTPRVASTALAMVTAAVEPLHVFTAFTTAGAMPATTSRPGGYGYGDHGISELGISPTQRLDDICALTARMPFGGTDCALPMLYALERKWALDAFVILTDSETWAGGIHPSQALRKYREATGIAAKCAVVGMVSNGFSIADPADAGMLDVVGFDLATPNLISEFVKQ